MEAFEQVHRLILQGLEDGSYPSVALAVGIGDQTYRKQTDGDCLDSTLFDMASLSKILDPTTIALRFLEEGRFRLYDTVADFFPHLSGGFPCRLNSHSEYMCKNGHTE